MGRFIVVCDYDGGTYVSQFDGHNAHDVARQWAAMIRAHRPIPWSSGYIADGVFRDLDDGLGPAAMDDIEDAWQMGGRVGRAFYTATIVLQSN